MFKIETLRAEEEAKTLNLSENLFHEALKDKPESKARFHVKNDKGEDFDIVYWDNDVDIEPQNTYPAYIERPFMAKYYIYDENDKDTLYLDFFNGLKNMVFEELNEYTIAISRVILSFTDLVVNGIQAGNDDLRISDSYSFAPGRRGFSSVRLTTSAQLGIEEIQTLTGTISGYAAIMTEDGKGIDHYEKIEDIPFEISFE